jgi:hypothetical protein
VHPKSLYFSTISPALLGNDLEQSLARVFNHGGDCQVHSRATAGSESPNQNVLGHDRTTDVALEGQQQVLRAAFPSIRDSVRVLLEVGMNRFTLKFHETKDLKVRNEIYRLCRELIKLDEPWKFRPIST